MRLIDLRSDTVTRPSASMRGAMARAEVGDDVFGEDPTVRLLEERVASLLGKEAALFVSSGTLANQLAIGLAAGPGDEVICEAGSHCVAYEGGALSAIWGAQARTIEGARGCFTAEQLRAALRPQAFDHLPRSRLLSVENTHNRGGGTVWPLAQLQEVTQAARAAGLAVHLDGARLWNAAAASQIAPATFAACADTVSVCLSKGLGAPVGSLLASTKEAIARARRLRKRLGGGMRQVGILAAAGLVALDENLPRIGEDHDEARMLACALATLPSVRLDPETVETNLVFVDFAPPVTASALLEALRARAVLATPDGVRRIRLVTHLDARGVAQEATARIADALDAVCRSA